MVEVKYIQKNPSLKKKVFVHCSINVGSGFLKIVHCWNCAAGIPTNRDKHGPLFTMNSSERWTVT